MKELINTYISDHKWSGKLTIDGGWGPKAVVIDLAAMMPLGVLQFDAVIDQPNLSEAFSPNKEEFSSVKEEAEYYTISFKGSDYAIFNKFVVALNKIGTVHAVLTNDAEPPETPTQLVVSENNYQIQYGHWVPSFKYVDLVAGWADEADVDSLLETLNSSLSTKLQISQKFEAQMRKYA